MAQYTQRTQPMHRHSKWLKNTFGDIGVDNPACQTVCDMHVNPEFLNIVKARSNYKELVESKFEAGPSTEPDNKKTKTKKRASTGKVKRDTKSKTKSKQLAQSNASDKTEENIELSTNTADTHLKIKQEPVEIQEEPPPKRPKKQIPQKKVTKKRSNVKTPANVKGKLLKAVTPSTMTRNRTKKVNTVKESVSSLTSEIIIKEDPDSLNPENIPSVERIQIKQEVVDENINDYNKSIVESEPTTSQGNSGLKTIKYEDHNNFINDFCNKELQLEIKTEPKEIEDSDKEDNPSFTVEITRRNTPKHFNTVKELLDDLVEREFITTSEMDVLAAHKLESSLLKDDTRTSAMHSKLQAFAVTLYVYSPEAYDYIRENYTTVLPDTTVIREWLVKPRGNTGFSSETLVAIHAQIARSKSLVCLDIKQITLAPSRSYQGPKQRLHINTLDWSVACANSVLVFTAVAIDANWKLPFGYFWMNVVKDKANLVKVAISILEKVGMVPVAITFDYNKDNMEMCKQLSKNIISHHNKHLASVFLSNSGEEILLFPDPRGILEDMYKNVTNMNTILDDKLNPVILDRSVLQKYFHTGTNPRQLLRKIISSELFKNDCAGFTESTVRFFKNLHVVLDFVSCRVDSRNFKLNRVVNSSSEPLMETLKYFESLQVKDPTLQNCIWGLCTLIDSALMFIFHHHTHRFKIGRFVGSTYFLANFTPLAQNIRNPSAIYFQREYKATVQQIALEIQQKGKANVYKVSLLKCKSSVDRINITTYLSNGSTLMYVPDDLKVLFGCNDTEYEDMIVLYIAKFVTYSLVRRLKCEICIRAMRTGKVLKAKVSRFAVKLENPTLDVVKICKKANTVFKCDCGSKSKVNVDGMIIKVMEEFIGRPLFDVMAYHQFDTDGTCNHIVELAKAVAELYLHTRIKWAFSLKKKANSS